MHDLSISNFIFLFEEVVRSFFFDFMESINSPTNMDPPHLGM